MSKKITDIAGQKFERWTVLKFDKIVGSHSYWICKCDCGNIKSVRKNCLIRGETKSCGCLNREITKKRLTTHGMYYTKTYNSWLRMIQRCNNPNISNYKNYGGRGITVCKRWLKFENFYADMGNKPERFSLDRIDNNKGYYKENCRWVTQKEQCRNRRNNVNITYKKKTKLLLIWSEELGINYNVLWQRIKKYNWSVEKAFETFIK